MTENELIFSDERCLIIDGLYKIGASKRDEVSARTIARLVELVSHRDATLREEVAAAGGIRLRLPELYPALFSQLLSEQDEDVKMVLIDAWAALVMNGADDQHYLCKVFAQFALDESCADEVRDTAYLSLMKILGKITPQEYAKSPSELSFLHWKRELVAQLGLNTLG